VLTATALLVAYRVAPHRLAAKPRLPEGDPAWNRAAASAGLPPSAVLGLRSALGSGSARSAAPVRSALLGAVVAVVVIVTSITFGASLNALVSQPSLYGWNWDYALLAGFSGAENLPAAQTAALLDHDPAVAHWAGVYFESATLDRTGVPVLAMTPGAGVGPSMLSGHALAAPSQIVLGPATLAALHAHVGGTLTANVDGHARTLHVVGTATLPTIGGSGQPVMEMGSGAVMATSLFSATDRDQQGSPVPGPMAAFITVRPGVSQLAALHSLDHITAVLNRPSDSDGPVGGVVGALRPAEIANYRTVGATPALLAAVLAAGAVGALGLTLVASVRQRRRQFAVLKALGFTRRQLAASVAWQSSVAAVIGVIVGVPIGVALGRFLWTLFARGISAVPTRPCLWRRFWVSRWAPSCSPTWWPSCPGASPPAPGRRCCFGPNEHVEGARRHGAPLKVWCGSPETPMWTSRPGAGAGQGEPNPRRCGCRGRGGGRSSWPPSPSAQSSASVRTPRPTAS